MPVFDLKRATLVFSDGSVTPKTIEIKVGSGNLSYTESKPRVYIKNRQKLYAVMDGEEEPVDVSFDFIWEYLKSDTGLTPSIEDVLKNRGEAASWVSSDSDLCNPFAVDIIVTFQGPCVTDKSEVITLMDFRYEKLDHDASGGKVACSGKCNVKEASVTRV